MGDASDAAALAAFWRCFFALFLLALLAALEADSSAVSCSIGALGVAWMQWSYEMTTIVELRRKGRTSTMGASETLSAADSTSLAGAICGPVVSELNRDAICAEKNRAPAPPRP